MGIVSLNIIKSWFKTGLIPTEAQFHDTWDSFHHKEEKIPVQDILGIDELLDTKADKEVLEDHLINPEAHKELLDVKLDKVDFDATAKNLDDRLLAIENPDAVLKYGDLILQGLELKILPSAFEWVLNKEKYVHPDEFTTTVSAATAGMYRTDIIVGNLSGGYDIIEGEEASNGAAAAEPAVPDGTIKLGFISVFGNAVEGSGNSEGDLLKGEIYLPAYPNTRNDGQLPTNRVLGTDENGHLKMYTIATAPAPFMEILIPDSTLPSTTTNFTIKGAFFTPAMTVVIEGQVINYITFINDNLIKVNVTTSAEEGSYAVTLNNGLSATFQNALLIVLGNVFAPKEEEWNNLSLVNINEGDAVRILSFGSISNAEWLKEFDITKDWRLKFSPVQSPLGIYPAGQYQNQHLKLVNAEGNTVFMYQVYRHGSGGLYHNCWTAANGWSYVTGNPSSSWENLKKSPFELRYVGGVLFAYENNVLGRTFNDILLGNLKLVITSLYYDFEEIKYIETF